MSIAFFFFLVLSAPYVRAEEEEMVGNPDGLVEVHLKGDPFALYIERRTNWSLRFNVQYESFYPSNYVSPADKAPYSNIFGSNQGSLISMSYGGQYNAGIGAAYVDVLYGAGTIAGLTTGSSLVVSKYGINAGIMFDRLSPSPWVSPYIGIQALYFNYSEPAVSVSGTTAVTTGVTAGISIHMNRVDPEAASEAYINYGVKNTFIDVFAIQYNTSASATDPDLQTSPSFGAGFHLEF